MRQKHRLTAYLLAAFMLAAVGVRADDNALYPGGTALDRHTQKFKNLKIVMDIKARNIANLNFAAVVARRIMEHPGSKLVVVVEGPAITAFAKDNYLDHQGAIDNWVSLAEMGVKVEYCGNSVKGAGLKPEDMMGLTQKNPAAVNPGAFPSIAYYESLGYQLVIPEKLD